MFKRIWQYAKQNRFFLLVVIGSGLGVSKPASAGGLSPDESASLIPITVFVNTDLQFIPDITRLRTYRLMIQGFHDIGYSVTFGYRPAKRLIESVDEGKVSAICLRSSGMEERDNILRVPESIHQLHVYGYSNPELVPESGSWRDMNVETLGLLYGAQDPRPYVPEPLLKSRIVRTPDRIIGARMALAKRLDIVAFPEIVFHAHEEFDHNVMTSLVRLTPELGSIETYCFLNVGQEHMLAPLTEAFRRLKRNDPKQYDDNRYPLLISDEDFANLPPLPGYSD
ncbi:MAG: hypothetical protein K6L80_09300 [Agarilytica sp.]